MKKIKLLFVLPSLEGGGAERIVCNLMSVLNKNIFDVNLFLFNNKGVYWDLLSNDINIFFGSRNKRYSKWIIIKNLYRVSKDMDIIVGSMELMPTYFSVLVGKLLRKKIIGWVHINIDSILNDKNKIIRFLHRNILLKFFYNKLDRIVAVSNGAKENISKYLNDKNRNKVECIYNPIKINEIKEKAEEELVEKIEKPFIIGIGRLERQKNFILLIKAYRILLDRGIKHNLIILGQGSQKEYLVNEVKKLDMEEKVKFLGFKENPYKYLNQANVFIQSSIYEGLPTVLIEALVLNVPVVATNCPDGAKEILDNGKYGLLVKMNDEKALADAIEKILNDRDLQRKYKIKSKDGINRFDDKYITHLFEELFLKMMKKTNIIS